MSGGLRPSGALAALAALALLAGCGKAGSSRSEGEGPARPLQPVVAPGAVSVATSNTTRLGGSSPAADAAAVARAVYPGLTPQSRPAAVVLADEGNWAGALSSSVLAGLPVGAPLLYASASSLPEVTSETLKVLKPVGLAALGGAQVIAVGTTAAPAGLSVQSVPAGNRPRPPRRWRRCS